MKFTRIDLSVIATNYRQQRFLAAFSRDSFTHLTKSLAVKATPNPPTAKIMEIEYVDIASIRSSVVRVGCRVMQYWMVGGIVILAC